MPDSAGGEQAPVDLRHRANDGVVSKNIVICLDGTGLRTNIGEAPSC